MKSWNIAVIGATGVVGREILSVLEKRNLPIQTLSLFASEKSVGKEIAFRGKTLRLQKLSEESFKSMDVVFFAAGSENTRAFLPWARKAGCLCIDSSSAFRMDPNVPLVIPEINPHALKNHQGLIASPNCVATLLLMALYPLHRAYGLKRVIASTYQAASGGGKALMEKLVKDSRSTLENPQPTDPYTYGFNLFPHQTPFSPNGYVQEELKVLEESRKILEEPSLSLSATCVRVPVLRAHSISVNAEFKCPFIIEDAYSLIKDFPGLSLMEDHKNNRFATPLYASGKDDVFCGRLRLDACHPNTLELWIVGDQLLKGAALNAVQIAEQLYEESLLG
jgi:aspartate-semialdehyde dehydrogenase